MPETVYFKSFGEYWPYTCFNDLPAQSTARALRQGNLHAGPLARAGFTAKSRRQLNELCDPVYYFGFLPMSDTVFLNKLHAIKVGVALKKETREAQHGCGWASWTV